MRFRIVNIVVDTKGQQIGTAQSHERDEALLNIAIVDIPKNLVSLGLKAVGDNYVELRLTTRRELD